MSPANIRNLNPRATEIKELIASNELITAVNRLMDLTTDFSNKHKNDAVLLKSNSFAVVEDIRRIGRTSENQADLNKIKLKVLELCDKIEEDHHKAVSDRVANNRLSLTNSTLVESRDNSDTDMSLTPLEIERKKFLDQSQRMDDASSKVFEGNKIYLDLSTESLPFELNINHLDIKLGEITVVVGENGSGKTTLIKILAGLTLPDKGELSYPALTHSQADWINVKGEIAYLPQVLRRRSNTVLENLHFTASINGLYGQENIDEVNFILHRMGLSKYRDSQWENLSGGFKTRFALAEVLIWKPKMMILDEPLANLDIKVQRLFLNDLRNLADSLNFPMAILLSSQHLTEVESIADQLIFMDSGKATYIGPTKDFDLNRSFNSFELRCNLQKDILYEVLSPLNFNEILIEGDTFLINTPLHVSGNDILRLLVEKNSQIHYFSDISQSTRKMFNNKI